MDTAGLVDPSRVDALLARARREVDEGVLPACQLALAYGGELVAFETFGEARSDTRFAIFSQTKAFVCSLFWMILAETDVSLDDRVADLVPGFGANGKDEVTVEHVLTHGAGLPAALLNPFEWDDVAARRAAFAAWTLSWEPGTRFEYHALSGHWLLCDIIETVTSTRFLDALRERVVSPLGLRTFVLGGERAAEPIAPLSIVGEPNPELPPPSHEQLLALADPGVRVTGIPAGGGVSTAADVAMFYQALLHNPDAMWEPAVLSDATGHIRNPHDDPGLGFPMNYGLGVRIAGDDGLGAYRGLAKGARVFGHDGAGGQIAWADPDSGVSFCYLTNGLDDDLLRQRRRFASISNRAWACGSS